MALDWITSRLRANHFAAGRCRWLTCPEQDDLKICKVYSVKPFLKPADKKSQHCAHVHLVGFMSVHIANP